MNPLEIYWHNLNLLLELNIYSQNRQEQVSGVE